MSDALYDTDFVTWTERQAAALRDAAGRGSNLPIDWENLAEEIEDAGREIRNKVGSLACQITVHLLKIACSTSVDQHSHWAVEVDGFRNQLARQLADNGALRAGFALLAEEEFGRALKLVERTFKRYGETSALSRLKAWKTRGITADEILTDGLFPEPGSLTFSREAD